MLPLKVIEMWSHSWKHKTCSHLLLLFLFLGYARFNFLYWGFTSLCPLGTWSVRRQTGCLCFIAGTTERRVLEITSIHLQLCRKSSFLSSGNKTQFLVGLTFSSGCQRMTLLEEFMASWRFAQATDQDCVCLLRLCVQCELGLSNFAFEQLHWVLHWIQRQKGQRSIKEDILNDLVCGMTCNGLIWLINGAVNCGLWSCAF